MEDRDLDSYPDTFLDVPRGSTLCFRVVARENATVTATATTQNYPGSLALSLDDAKTGTGTDFRRFDHPPAPPLAPA